LGQVLGGVILGGKAAKFRVSSSQNNEKSSSGKEKRGTEVYIACACVRVIFLAGPKVQGLNLLNNGLKSLKVEFRPFNEI